MTLIIKNVIKEQLRRKTILSVAIFGVLLTLLITTQSGGNLKINDRNLTSFTELLPVGVGMVVFFASLLTIFISMSTIPQEFERKTTHLILVRPIEKWQYMLALVLGNIAVSLLILGILSVSLILFTVTKGQLSLLPRLIGTLFILAVNISVLSTLISVCSIKLPAVMAGVIGFIFYLFGMFHNYLATFAKASESILLSWLVKLTPNIIGLQQEAAAWLKGNLIDWSVILGMVIYLYLLFWGPIFLFRKEV